MQTPSADSPGSLSDQRSVAILGDSLTAQYEETTPLRTDAPCGCRRHPELWPPPEPGRRRHRPGGRDPRGPRSRSSSRGNDIPGGTSIQEPAPRLDRLSPKSPAGNGRSTSSSSRSSRSAISTAEPETAGAATRGGPDQQTDRLSHDLPRRRRPMACTSPRPGARELGEAIAARIGPLKPWDSSGTPYSACSDGRGLRRAGFSLPCRSGRSPFIGTELRRRARRPV